MSFRRCDVCGSPHGREKCPVREYNDKLEARDKDRITAEMLFPNQPDLVILLKALQDRWLRQELRGN